jgi:hypothetical protein
MNPRHVRTVIATLLFAATTSASARNSSASSSSPTPATRPRSPPSFAGSSSSNSFEFEDAAVSFREAQQADPGFALAYWGEAMTYTHGIWNEQDMTAARAVLARLGATPAERKAKAGTPREQAWLTTAEILYG